MSAGAGHPLLPLLLAGSSFLWWKHLILPWWDMFIMGSKELLIIMSRGSGTLKPRTKTLGCPGDVGAPMLPTWLSGKHITPEEPSSSPPSGAGEVGGRVAELVQAVWLYPSQPFLPLVLRDLCPSCPHPCGTQERYSFAKSLQDHPSGS